MTSVPPVKATHDVPKSQPTAAQPTTHGLVHDNFSTEEEAGFRYPEPDPNSPHGRALAALRATLETSNNDAANRPVPLR